METKDVKGSLKIWNLNISCRIDMQVEEGKEEINKVDEFLTCCKEELVEDLVIRRSKVTGLLGKKLVLKENMLV